MRHTRKWSLMLSGALACQAAPFATTQTLAQTNEDDVVLADPIVVTARLIEEPIQRIPFGITVIDGSDVEDRRIDGSLSISRATPGLNSAGFGVRNGFFPNVRGVGSFFPLSGDDASVPVFIDGVPLAVRSQDRDLFDVQRVEVLRGPQNTLYGRNAQAGAISITSIAPSFVPEARLNFEAGTDGYGRVEAAVSGPLHEDIAGRLAVRVNTEGGDVPNDAAPQTQRSGNVANLAGSLLWDASEKTEARLNLRYGNYDETPLGPLFADLPGFPRAFQDTSPIYELETLGASITVEHEFESEINLTSVSGFQTYQTFFTQ
ncbi:MAG: TonB-dependent receptor plug domain-containing protein, partial [Pseudomonadota bacterium]